MEYVLQIVLFWAFIYSNVGSVLDNFSSAMGHICVMWDACLLRAYASSVSEMYTSYMVDWTGCI